MIEEYYNLHTDIIGNCFIVGKSVKFGMFDKLEREQVIKVINELNSLYNECKALDKEVHLIHMSSMFNTVKSFKGDISKRYVYNEETDTIYDTANSYGQYYKILDKKEITALLNEYNTLLESDSE